MTLPLTWMSSTEEGAQLGQLASSQVSVEWRPWPWWSFPWQPWEWFFAITGSASHSFYAALGYFFLSLLIGLIQWRRHSWRAGLACFLTAMLILVGGLQSSSCI